MHFFMEFANKATGLRLLIPKRKVKMNVCSIWPFAQISQDFYYLDTWQCARYFVAALFKELALITIREIRGLESRSRTSRSRSQLIWQSLVLGLVSKFEPGLGLGGHGLDYTTGVFPLSKFYTKQILHFTKATTNFSVFHLNIRSLAKNFYKPRLWVF